MTKPSDSTADGSTNAKPKTKRRRHSESRNYDTGFAKLLMPIALLQQSAEVLRIRQLSICLAALSTASLATCTIQYVYVDGRGI